jgi:hypothetical protein
VAGYGNFEKNYKSLGTWQVSEIYEAIYRGCIERLGFES